MGIYTPLPTGTTGYPEIAPYPDLTSYTPTIYVGPTKFYLPPSPPDAWSINDPIEVPADWEPGDPTPSLVVSPTSPGGTDFYKTMYPNAKYVGPEDWRQFSTPVQTPPLPGSPTQPPPPPTSGTPNPFDNNELIRQFLGSNPTAAFNNVFPDAVKETPYGDFLRGSQSRLYGSYLGDLPNRPNMLLQDFLKEQDLEGQWRNLAPRQRGETPSRFAPPVRWAPKRY